MIVTPKKYPKIAFWHHHLGIGDLIWHIPYMRVLAKQSQNGKVTLITRPSTMPHELLADEDCIEDIVIFDRKPRKSEGRKGEHDSLYGQKKFIKELQSLDIDIIYIFSNRSLYGRIARKAGIKKRAGYGFRWSSRLYLSQPPYLVKDDIKGSRVYYDATKFMMSHGFIEAPIVPKMRIDQSIVSEMHALYQHLPTPWFAFSIGGSETEKCWDAQSFAKLADMIVRTLGGTIFLLGGSQENGRAQHIINHTQYPDRVRAVTDKTIRQSAGLLKSCHFTIGNDTGALNLSVANDTPALGLFGATLPLEHDPILYGIQAHSMREITPEFAFDAFMKNYKKHRDLKEKFL